MSLMRFSVDFCIETGDCLLFFHEDRSWLQVSFLPFTRDIVALLRRSHAQVHGIAGGQSE